MKSGQKRGDTVRMTITMPTPTKEAIDALSEYMGVSQSYAAQHLVKIGLAAEAVIMNGGEVVANYPDGKSQTLANKWGNFVLSRFPSLGNGKSFPSPSQT